MPFYISYCLLNVLFTSIKLNNSVGPQVSWGWILLVRGILMSGNDTMDYLPKIAFSKVADS